MILTPAQISAAESGQDVRFLLNGVEFVVVRSEELDKLKALAHADHEELRSMLAQSFVANGWDEPGMEQYDSYPAKP